MTMNSLGLRPQVDPDASALERLLCDPAAFSVQELCRLLGWKEREGKFRKYEHERLHASVARLKEVQEDTGAPPAPSAKPKTAKRSLAAKKVAPIASDDFAGQQLSLFQTFLANSPAEREALSNVVDLWDSIPRYAISRSLMSSLRTDKGFLDVIEIPFNYRGRPLVALIHPARIQGKNGQRVSYYPGAREELVEHALRKISVEQSAGFFDKEGFRSGARFSLHRLRKELEEQGHGLRYDELVDALDILSLSALEIVATDGAGDAAFARSTYLPALSGVRRKEYEANREAKWVAQFHPLLTQSIDQVTYRQFNYERLMQCSTQLARWLSVLLVLKYTQAATVNSFDIRFSTVKRDSAMLKGYARSRDAVAAVDDALEELITLGTRREVKRSERRGIRAKLEDVTYTLFPTREFAAEQRAANRRQRDATAPAPSGNLGAVLNADSTRKLGSLLEIAQARCDAARQSERGHRGS
jgi:hypothetical protein